MHVSIYSPPSVRRARAGAAIALLATWVCAASAAGIPESPAAPALKDAAAFSSDATAFSARARKLREAAPEAAVLDHGLFRDRFDLTWQLQQAMNQHRTLGDLSSVGLRARADGGYDIDYNAAPQWQAYENFIPELLAHTNWELFGDELKSRGLRDEDVAALRNYVATHDASKAVRAAQLPVTLSFAKIVNRYDKLKLPVTDNVVLAYVYQRSLAAAEARWKWTSDLLGSLDATKRRVFFSRLTEATAVGRWSADDQPVEIADVLATLRRPDIEQAATAEAKGETP